MNQAMNTPKQVFRPRCTLCDGPKATVTVGAVDFRICTWCDGPALRREKAS